MDSEDTFTSFIAFLDHHNAHYRLIEHDPEGRTDVVSTMRGNALSQAAKCIVLMVKIGKKVTKYILGIIPGDARVDLNAVKALMSGTYISFASPDIAEKLAGSVPGTILPFSFNPELQLIVDPALIANDEIYFNAARLDRSMALKTSDYMALSRPRIERIALTTEAQQDDNFFAGLYPNNQEIPMAEEFPYVTNLDVKFKHFELIDLPAIVEACKDRWFNQTLTEVNDSVIRIGIVEGEYHWHKHDHDDEFFFVLEGQLLIDLEDKTMELNPNQGVTISKGVLHRPRAPQKTVMLMVETSTIQPTGN